MIDFVSALRFFKDSDKKLIQVVTDDVHIWDEIAQFENNSKFLPVKPAPKRIADKVSNSYINNLTKIIFFRMVKAVFSSTEL